MQHVGFSTEKKNDLRVLLCQPYAYGLIEISTGTDDCLGVHVCVCRARAGAFYALVALLLASAPGVTAAVTTGTTDEELGRELAAVVQRHVALTHKSPKLL